MRADRYFAQVPQDESTDAAGALPPDLVPVALRLARADEAVFEIADLSSLWSMAGPLQMEQRRSGDRSTTVLTGIRPVPPRLWLLFSEAINHLRAAIDNTVWALLEREHGPVEETAAPLVAMPIQADEEGFSRWWKRRGSRGLDGLVPGSQLHVRIRSLQPFVDTSSAVPSTNSLLAAIMDVEVEHAHPLSLLQAYSNGDKHRAIRVALTQSTATRMDQPFLQQQRGFSELRIGQVMASGKWGELIPIETSTAVMIQRPDPYSAIVPPATELSRIHEYVREVAIPTLTTGLVLPRLVPPHIDLGDNGETDQERLSNGRWQSATQRMDAVNQERFAAAMQADWNFPPVVDESDG